jgi:hypothetical protein
MKRSAQRILTPSNRQLPPEDSHSDSGSHLSDRHAMRTWMVIARLVTAPKEVMASEADLLYRRHIVVMGGGGREEGGRKRRRKRRGRRVRQEASGERADITYLAGLNRIISEMTEYYECRLIQARERKTEDIKSGWLNGKVRTRADNKTSLKSQRDASAYIRNQSHDLCAALPPLCRLCRAKPRYTLLFLSPQPCQHRRALDTMHTRMDMGS